MRFEGSLGVVRPREKKADLRMFRLRWSCMSWSMSPVCALDLRVPSENARASGGGSPQKLLRGGRRDSANGTCSTGAAAAVCLSPLTVCGGGSTALELPPPPLLVLGCACIACAGTDAGGGTRASVMGIDDGSPVCMACEEAEG